MVNVQLVLELNYQVAVVLKGRVKIVPDSELVEEAVGVLAPHGLTLNCYCLHLGLSC